MTYLLKDLVHYSNSKVNYDKLADYNYISTENMLPNFGGITKSSYVPKEGKSVSFNKGDILLSNIRPYFKKLYYAKFDGGCSNDVLCFKISDEKLVNGKYLYYALSTNRFIDYVVSTSKGTKMPRGDKNAIMQYTISIHDIKTQEHIVDIIGSIDNKIEKNYKIISNLLKLGDLIQLKSNCKLIDCNALKFNYGKSIPKNNRNSGKFKLFSSNGITDTINESNSHGCSIIFGCRGTIGTVSYSYDDCFVLNTAMYINCDEKDIGKLFFAIRQKKGFVDCATGAVQLQITINEINKERIKISNNDDLNIILRFINNIYMENEKLKDLKQNYLLKFFQ